MGHKIAHVYVIMMSIEVEIYFMYIFTCIHTSAVVIWSYNKLEGRIDRTTM